MINKILEMSSIVTVFIIIISANFFMIYLAASFVSISFNPLKWGELGRIIFAVGILFIREKQ